MFHKISTKILLVCIVVLALLTVGIAGIAWRRIAADGFRSQQEAALNILSLVTLNIQSQYNRVVDFQLEFVARRRELLKQKNATALAYLAAQHQAAVRGEHPLDQARRDSLAWLETQRRDNPGCLVFDQELRALSVPDPTLRGKHLLGFRNLRGGDAFLTARDRLFDRDELYSVVFWPDDPAQEPRKQLAYFTLFKPWGWIVAAMEPLGDLEDHVTSKQEAILQEVGDAIAGISVPGSGYLFLFSGDGEMLSHPFVPRGPLSEVRTDAPNPALFHQFIAASQTPGKSFSYTLSLTGFIDEPVRKIAFVEYFRPLDWYVGYTINEADLKTPAVGLIRELLVLILTAAVLGAAVLLIMIRRFTRPLVELTSLVKELPEREFILDQAGLEALAELSQHQRDESGRLAAAFLGLQDRLQRHLGELTDLHAERLRHIQDLEHVKTRLEATVAERTANLVRTNQRLTEEMREREAAVVSLRAAKEQAEAATRAKSEFLTVMSHEIRTPLNTILGMAEMLGETPLSPPQQQYMEHLGKAGDHLLELINNILEFSRIESGQVEIHAEPFDLRDVLEDLDAMLQPGAEAKGLGFTVRVLPQDLPCQRRGDAYKLRHILVNIIGNAVKFTTSGGVRITVTDQGQPEGQLLFTVADTGEGIPPERQAAVFDTFTQADSSIRRRHGGSGLGLAIARKLTQAMGGQLRLESEPGQGTTVFLTLPLPVDQDTRAPAPLPQTPPRWNPEAPLRVLLAEDMEANRELIRLYLEDAPVRLTYAVNGVEAVERYAAEAFDVVLMDMEMPEVDGLEATRYIRELERENERPHTPVLALTAHAFDAFRAQSLAAGCDDFLTKPLNKAALHAALLQWGSPQQGALPSSDSGTAPAAGSGADQGPVANQGPGAATGGGTAPAADGRNGAMVDTGPGEESATGAGPGAESTPGTMPGAEHGPDSRSGASTAPMSGSSVEGTSAPSSGPAQEAASAPASNSAQEAAPNPASGHATSTASGPTPDAPQPLATDAQVAARLAALLPTFCQSLAGLLHDATEAAQREDWRTVQRIGHTVKGTAALYGLTTVSHLGTDLENAAKKHERTTVMGLVGAIRTELERTIGTSPLPH